MIRWNAVAGRLVAPAGLGAAFRKITTALAGLLVLGATAVAPAYDVFTFTAGPGGAVAIPDNASAGTTIPLPVAGLPGTIRDIKVTFDGAGPCGLNPTPVTNTGISHTWVGDLVITLTAPSGVTVTLLNRPNLGQGGIDLCAVVLDDTASVSIQDSGVGSAPFVGRWRPAGTLSSFTGQSPNGTWLMRVADRASGDVGFINQFSLHIRTTETDETDPPPIIGFASPDRDGFSPTQTPVISGAALSFGSPLDTIEYRVLPSPDWTPVAFSGNPALFNFSVNLGVDTNVIEMRARSTSGSRTAQVQRHLTFDPSVNQLPTVAILDPPTDTSVSSTVNDIQVSGTATDPDGTISVLQYQINNEGWINLPFTPSGNSATWTFTAPIPTDTTNIRVRAFDNDEALGPESLRRIFRFFGNLPPNVVIEDPDGDRILPVDQTSLPFSGSAFDPDGFLTLVEYRLTPETLFETGFTGVGSWFPAEDAAGDWTSWLFVAQPLETGVTYVEVRGVDNNLLAGPAPVRRITRLGSDDNIPVVEILVPAEDIIIAALDPNPPFSGTGSAAVGREVIQVAYRVNGGVFTPVTITPGGNGVNFQFTPNIPVGTNLVEVYALDDAFVQSQIKSRTVTRETDDRIPPVVTITQPDRDMSVPNSTIILPLAGTTFDADGNVIAVQYRIGRSLTDMGPWVDASQVGGNFENWTFNANLVVGTNIIQVRAFDNDLIQSEVRTRVISRLGAAPTVAILSPQDKEVMRGPDDTPPVTGTASDPDGNVALVRWRARADGVGFPAWNPATATAPNFTAWTFNVPLEVGLNFVEVQAIDNDNIQSPIARIELTRVKPVPGPDLVVLTEFTDVWGSQNINGQFQPPTRFDLIGFEHDLPKGWKAFAGDIDGDGLADMIVVTEFEEAWTAINDGEGGLLTPTRNSFGWTHSESLGITTLAGDFNGDGRTDLLRVGSDGSLGVAFSGSGLIGPPAPAGNPGLRYAPAEGLWVFAADMDGDGIDDLVQINNSTGEVLVARGAGTAFGDAELWGTPGLRHDPANAYGLVFGDFTGNGAADIVEIHNGLTWVATSNGTSLNDVAYWGGPGFHADPAKDGRGWWVFAGDVDGDGLDDLVQLNGFGHIWVAPTLGNQQFGVPTLNAGIGFEHKPAGRWQVFTGRAYPVAEDE